jgi:hypothetical protein
MLPQAHAPNNNNNNNNNISLYLITKCSRAVSTFSVLEFIFYFLGDWEPELAQLLIRSEIKKTRLLQVNDLHFQKKKIFAPQPYKSCYCLFLSKQ